MGNINIIISFLAFAIGIVQVEAAAWGYEGPTGVSNWTVHFPLCGGDRQSPINILNAEYDDDLEEFTKNGYNTTLSNLKISNNGHTVVIAIPSAVSKSLTVSREGLANSYYAFGFHFHWGSEDNKGSEHKIGGKAYPMEMHFIHVNSKYANISQAAMNEDGLLVFGTMIQISSSDSSVISTIRPKLNALIEPDTEDTITGITLDALFPVDSDEYFTYQGSLTTPGCNQAVSWHLHKNVLNVTQTTLNEFRKLKAHQGVNTNGLIANNFRPVQPLNSRKIKSSFKTDDDDDDDNNTSGDIYMKSQLTIIMTATLISVLLALVR